MTKTTKQEDENFWIDLGLMMIYLAGVEKWSYDKVRVNIEHDLFGYEQKKQEMNKYFLERCSGYRNLPLTRMEILRVIMNCSDLDKQEEHKSPDENRVNNAISLALEDSDND